MDYSQDQLKPRRGVGKDQPKKQGGGLVRAAIGVMTGGLGAGLGATNLIGKAQDMIQGAPKPVTSAADLVKTGTVQPGQEMPEAIYDKPGFFTSLFNPQRASAINNANMNYQGEQIRQAQGIQDIFNNHKAALQIAAEGIRASNPALSADEAYTQAAKNLSELGVTSATKPAEANLLAQQLDNKSKELGNIQKEQTLAPTVANLNATANLGTANANAEIPLAERKAASIGAGYDKTIATTPTDIESTVSGNRLKTGQNNAGLETLPAQTQLARSSIGSQINDIGDTEKLRSLALSGKAASIGQPGFNPMSYNNSKLVMRDPSNPVSAGLVATRNPVGLLPQGDLAGLMMQGSLGSSSGSNNTSGPAPIGGGFFAIPKTINVPQINTNSTTAPNIPAPTMPSRPAIGPSIMPAPSNTPAQNTGGWDNANLSHEEIMRRLMLQSANPYLIGQP